MPDIPQILSVQEGLREMGYEERLPFLMQPWITSLYVDCPPNMVFDASPNATLICPTKEEVTRYEAAIRRGDILFQAVPTPPNISVDLVTFPINRLICRSRYRSTCSPRQCPPACSKARLR